MSTSDRARVDLDMTIATTVQIRTTAPLSSEEKVSSPSQYHRGTRNPQPQLAEISTSPREIAIRLNHRFCAPIMLVKGNILAWWTITRCLPCRRRIKKGQGLLISRSSVKSDNIYWSIWVILGHIKGNNRNGEESTIILICESPLSAHRSDIYQKDRQL